LAEAAHAAASADNSQPWRLTWDGRIFRIGYDAARAGETTFPPEEPATLVSIGSVLENMDRAARALGASPFWEIPEGYDPSGDYARLTVNPDLPVPPDARQDALFARHTNRFPFRRVFLPASLAGTVLGAQEGAARCTLYTERGEVQRIGQLVRAASEVRFQTRELHEWLAGSLRFGKDAERGDGLDVATLHLPPGGRLFLKSIRDWRRMALLNKIGGHRFMALVDSRPVAMAPGLVAVIGGGGHRGTLDAGRLLGRVWIAMNALGLAVHPYYVLTDQLYRLATGRVPAHLVERVARLAEEVPAALGLRAGEAVHMLLRIGYPTRHPPRSRRLPLARVFTDLTEGPSVGL
jgi:hypothetical protein